MLISPASDGMISSTLGFERLAPQLMMHPRDAEARGLADGAEVKVWNGRGEVIMPLEVTDDVAPGVVASEKGTWLATSRTGQTISALVSGEYASRSGARRVLQRHAGGGEPLFDSVLSPAARRPYRRRARRTFSGAA